MQLNFDLQEKDDTPEILLNTEKEPSLLQNLPDDCVIVDIETTGLSPVNDSIIEISALKIKNGKVEEEFSSLINPKRLIPPFITKLTGISTEMVKNAEETRTVLKKFCNFIQTNPIVGHNIKFDLRFINKNLDKYFNKTLPNDYTDTLIFSRKIYTNLSSHKLTKIAEHLKISTDNAHRALNDCYMTYRIIKDMKERSSQ